MTATPVLLRTQGLAVGHGERTVLADVALEVAGGQLWFVLGPNGSGKTTLLRTLLGVVPALGGRIERDPALASRERTGFVPQRSDFNPSLPTTVREFVGLGTVGLRVSAADTAERIRWALRHVDLAGHERRVYWALSGGERQRALLARALVRRPSLLLLDEPTNHLDLRTADAFLHLLADLVGEERTTVLFVTHDLALAARWATHVALVHDGRVDAGPARTVLAHPAVPTLFGVEVDVAVGGPVAVRVRTREGRP